MKSFTQTGYGLILTLLICLASHVHANTYSSWWHQLWHTPDQQAAQMMQHQEYDSAYQTFQNEEWKAAAAYRAKHYQ